ncbi:DUF885 domain-containing protein [Amycolatopsis sp. cmx-4-68]|uniref:DUF885 domain-containing protein n=1 Tax=Amycolatopsis sp. cmx-4-68 TaxID=2790938 RepID=UPI00397C4E0A
MTPRAVADRYVDKAALLDPYTGASLGLNPGDDRQPDLSPAGFDAEAALARETLAELDAVSPADLDSDPAEQRCARLLRERLTAQLAVYDAGDHFRSLRNAYSPLHQVRQILLLTPTGTEEDWELVASRLRHLPGAVAGYRATLEEGIARGLLAAPRQCASVVDQLRAWTGEPGVTESWFAEFVAPAPEPLRPRLEVAAQQATRATAEFGDWLCKTYAPAASGVPDAVGRERYLRSARFYTGADVEVDEAYDWAWSEFHGVAAAMRSAAEEVLPGATALTAMHHLDEHGHAVEGVEGIRSWLQRLMDDAIENLDGVHFDIDGPLRRVESRIAPPGSAAAPYYVPPSLGFGRPGRTFLPTLGRETFPTWQIASTWYHEGVPGHHLQMARWIAVADHLSRYQVTLGLVAANAEGWALYAERLMDELGFFTDPARRLGYLDKQMLRIIRVIVDIGMHLNLTIPADSGFHPDEQWTPELATEFMATYHGSSAARRESEIIRYLGRPGQAIGYKLGERAWLRGREAAGRRAGSGFDLKAWHMKALSQGSLGLADLADNLATL